MKRTLGITLVLTLLTAAFGVGWALHGTPTRAAAAASTTLTGADPLVLAADTPSSSNTGTTTPGTSNNARQRYQSFVAAVAAKAGISANTLDTAIRDVAAQRVADAANAGVISQTRATQIENAIKNGTLSQLIQRYHQQIAAARADGHHPLLHWLRRILK